MAKNIINGPYLLDPRATQITVAWEAIVPQAFKVTARAADGRGRNRQASIGVSQNDAINYL